MISIIIPVYNVEKYIHKCIESILCQSYQDFEVILINDGSTDKSLEICDDYAKRDERLKIIHKENSNLSSSRSIGLDLSTGKYITFIDSSTWIHMNFLEILNNLISENSADIAICECEKITDKNNKDENIDINKELLTRDESLNKIYTEKYNNMVTISGKLYKKAIFKDLKFPLVKKHEDEYMIHKILFKANKVVYSDAKLLYYNSISTREFDEKQLHFIDAIEDRLNFCKANNLDFLIPKIEEQYVYELMYHYYKIKNSNMNHRKQICKEIKLKLYNIDSRSFNNKRKLLLSLFKISPSLSKTMLNSAFEKVEFLSFQNTNNSK